MSPARPLAIAPGIDYFDLEWLGRPHIIATGMLSGTGRVALVDPGPASSLAGLRDVLAGAGVALEDVEALLLTHIHLDHAGATGTIVREHPQIKVFVHERGVRHLIDPSRLLDSAGRLYGADMGRLWGEVAPVPPESVRSLRGGERIAVAGQVLEVADTPGHASHHMSYLDLGSGTAFVGDVGGIRIAPSACVVAPTPPPDIDLEAWSASLDRIAAWRPERLFHTHFGPSADPDDHLARLRAVLRTAGELVRSTLADGGTDDERTARFAREFRTELRRHLTEPEAAHYEDADPPEVCWMGLARYWRKKEGDTKGSDT